MGWGTDKEMVGRELELCPIATVLPFQYTFYYNQDMMYSGGWHCLREGDIRVDTDITG